MSSTDRLRELGLFDARAPRYTSYPPANHFNDGIGPDRAAAWMRSVTPGTRVSLYLHIPYCRRLFWIWAPAAPRAPAPNRRIDPAIGA